MLHLPRDLFFAAWLVWALYWAWWARAVKPTERCESLASRAAHIALLGGAVLLLGLPRWPGPWLGMRFVPDAAWPAWAGCGATLAGVALAIWARRCLGRNWSGLVTLKRDHALVTQGPYARVRHPIYTGLLLALGGSALGLGEWRGLVALALAAGSFRHKIRLEERWMAERFGAAWAAHCARTGALWPRGRAVTPTRSNPR